MSQISGNKNSKNVFQQNSGSDNFSMESLIALDRFSVSHLALGMIKLENANEGTVTVKAVSRLAYKGKKILK